MLAQNDTLFSNPCSTPIFMADGCPISIVCAQTAELIDIACQIRYQVYCRQYKFENAEKYPDKKECDDFDPISKHFLIRDDSTGKYIGTVRLVWPRAGKDGLLPIEAIYPGCFYDSSSTPEKLRKGSYMEVSRLALLRPDKSSTKFLSELARILYLLTLSYFYAKTELQYLYCFMDKRLARRLNMIGIPFVQVGTMVAYRGLRAPFCLTKQGSNERLSAGSQQIFQSLINNELITTF